MNPAQYAEHVGKDLRTVRRWLGRGEIPAATQYPDGRWDIPADAVRQAPLPGQVVTSANGHGGTSVARQVTQQPAQPVSLADALDKHPALLTVEQTALFLGISEYAVRQNVHELGGVNWGRNGSWLIPARSVRHYAGL